MPQLFDPTVKYQGPRAEFASLTGSPWWGLSVPEIIERFKRGGWRHRTGERLPTPYGLGPMVNHFTNAHGREVIWIPSYGSIVDEQIFSPEIIRRAMWLLWQAGVKVLLVGGTSGSADWRDPLGEETVRPGDFVIPWSFYRDASIPGTLPGTDMATGFLPRIALMGEPFCSSLGRVLTEKVNAELVPRPFRRLHQPSSVKVSIHPPMSAGGFESDFEVLTWRALTKMVSQEEGFPHALIFGDLVSPVLARQMGMHLLYYHIPSNWAQGHPATRMKITDALDKLYLQVLPQACLQLELELFETLEVPADCACTDNLKERPAVYLRSLTAK
jgi:hypothetical protein